MKRHLILFLSFMGKEGESNFSQGNQSESDTDIVRNAVGSGKMS